MKEPIVRVGCAEVDAIAGKLKKIACDGIREFNPDMTDEQVLIGAAIAIEEAIALIMRGGDEPEDGKTD